MIDSEKHRVSSELRKLKVDGRGVTNLNHGFTWSVASIVFPDLCDRPRDAILQDLIDRLAALIEPDHERTCRAHVWCDGLEECHGVNERWMAECESCGAMLGESFSEERTRGMLPNYCPCCGARIEEKR